MRNLVNVGFLLVLSVLAADAAVSWYNNERLIANDESVAHTHAVLARLESVLSTVTDAESGQRGYLLTGRPGNLDPYHAAILRIREELDDLAEFIQDNPAQQERLATLRPQVEAKLAVLDRVLVLRRDQGFDAALAAVLSERGRLDMEAIRGTIGTMREAEEQLLRLRDRQSAASATLTRWSLPAGTVVSVALLGLAYSFVLRESALRRQSAEAVRREREWFEVTLLGIGDGVIAVGVDARVRFMNPVAQELTGRTQADATGRPVGEVFRILNEETRKPVENPAERCLREGVVVGLANHTVLIARDGTERPIDDSGGPIRGQGGELVGAVLVFRDVSERRRTERALRESEARFRSLAESMPQLAWMARPDGHIAWYNRRWYEYTGTTPEQMEGWGWESAHDPDVLPEVSERWKASLTSGRPFDMVFPLKGADGKFRSFLTRVEPLRGPDGAIINWFGTNTDVSEAAAAQAALREARSRLDSALAAGEIGTWDWDINADRVRADHNLARVFGVTPEEAAGGPKRAYLRAVHPDDRSRVEAMLTGLPEAGDAPETEFRLLPPNGGLRWLIARGRVEPEPDGRGARLLGVVVDVTARKRAEEELLEADRRKDQFMAMLAHELRNPLSPIRNAAHLLRLRGDDIEAVAWAREVIDRQSAHMTRLIDELLDASRIAQGKVALRREPLDLSGLARAAAEDHRVGLEAGGLALDVELPPGQLWVRGDPVRLAQVFGNLLTNAGKFTDPGGRVTLRIAAENGEAVVSVRDTGIGFGPELQDRLFETFAQADSSLARSKGGLGLGLALVKGLVELHGGRVSASSEGPGRGAEFVFRLPEDGEPRAAQPPHCEWEASASRRVLLVEDNADAAESLRIMLELVGHETAVAESGPEGVETARRFRPEVVLCDLGLPGMSGYEVARALRADPMTASALIVAISGYGREEDQAQAREAGFDAALVKPVEPAVLKRLLDQPLPPQ